MSKKFKLNKNTLVSIANIFKDPKNVPNNLSTNFNPMTEINLEKTTPVNFKIMKHTRNRAIKLNIFTQVEAST